VKSFALPIAGGAEQTWRLFSLVAAGETGERRRQACA
jgi:hypothetical protein